MKVEDQHMSAVAGAVENALPALGYKDKALLVAFTDLDKPGDNDADYNWVTNIDEEGTLSFLKELVRLQERRMKRLAKSQGINS